MLVTNIEVDHSTCRWRPDPTEARWPMARSMLSPRSSVCFARVMSRTGKAVNPAPRRRPMASMIVAALLVVSAIVWWLRPRQAPAPAPGATAASVVSPRPAANPEQMVGRWVRPDGGYVLEITGCRPGGRLDVSYFNPRPIHVGQAAWTQTSEGLNVFVELRDTGYPGATYGLRFDPAGDRFVGTYYQPAAAQTFDVEFVRLPAGP